MSDNLGKVGPFTEWERHVSLFSSCSHPVITCQFCGEKRARWHYVFGYTRGHSLSDVMECDVCGSFVTRADLEGAWGVVRG